MKTRTEFVVPLSGPAIALLSADALERGRPGALVFPGVQRSDTPLSDACMVMLMRRICGSREPPGVSYRDTTTGKLPVPHGFRSSFADRAGDATLFPQHVVEAALAHAAGDKVTVAYRRGNAYDFRAKLMEEWGAFCTGG
jgi:integrase